jgi:hypothetical protein
VPYVLSLVLLAVGLLLLALLLVGAYRALRRVRAAQRQVVSDIRDRTGLLTARAAGVRVAITERLPRAGKRESPRA